ncbi:MAG: hypothetical protein KDE19_07695 [Caldilineaceae bacterium]|nr:hypothetical protein [Caldilineaceae bacterium]
MSFPAPTYLVGIDEIRETGYIVAMLDELIDTVGEDEAHPLAGLMETIGALMRVMKIEQYLSRRVIH